MAQAAEVALGTGRLGEVEVKWESGGPKRTAAAGCGWAQRSGVSQGLKACRQLCLSSVVAGCSLCDPVPSLALRGDPAPAGPPASPGLGADVAADSRAGAHEHALHLAG